MSRFGDSWSARLTVYPGAHLELQGSHADVHSPEHREGFGTDQSKWSASGRWTGSLRGSPAYALLEWAQTSEAEGFFVFHSFLGEGAWTLGHHRLLYRFERTERPEEAAAPGSISLGSAASGELHSRHHALDGPHRRIWISAHPRQGAGGSALRGDFVWPDCRREWRLVQRGVLLRKKFVLVIEHREPAQRWAPVAPDGTVRCGPGHGVHRG